MCAMCGGVSNCFFVGGEKTKKFPQACTDLSTKLFLHLHTIFVYQQSVKTCCYSFIVCIQIFFIKIDFLTINAKGFTLKSMLLKNKVVLGGSIWGFWLLMGFE
jgi:hypothetical protein